MPTNSTFVCFECRQTAKADALFRACPRCRRSMRNVGKRFPVPARTDTRGWLKAEADLDRIEAQNREFFLGNFARRREIKKILAARRG